MSTEHLNSTQEALNLLIYLSIKLTALFILISYVVGILQEFIPPKRIQSILSSKNGKGYFISALLGAITPFCSCSTIPFLKGLLRARAGFGPMMVFLFSSPLLNPIIIGLFAVTFGWKVTVIYFSTALGVAMLAGITLEKLGFERYVRASAYEEPKPKCCSPSCCSTEKKQSMYKRVWNTTWKDFKKVLPYLMIGIFIGSLIYGFVPTEFIAQYAGEDNLSAIPVSAIIGIPLYVRAEAVIPLSAALASKGMSLGAIMALIIGSAGASLTEVILLRSFFKMKMILAFLVVVLSMAIGAGLIFTWIAM